MERFRESRRPLGRIVAEVYKERENVWWNQSVTNEGDSTSEISALRSQVGSLQQQTKAGGGRRNPPQLAIEDKPGVKKEPKVKPNRGEGNNVVVYVTGGGQQLCKAFQSGKCQTRGKKCEGGLHKCGGVMPGSSTKVCGLNNHGGQKCNRCKRA